MKTKTQKVNAWLVVLLIASVASSLLEPTDARADPPTAQVTCKDGKKKTASKSAAPPKDILNDKDYQAACKSNGGYKKPKANNNPAGANTQGQAVTRTGNGCGGVETAIIKCDQDNSAGVKNNGIWALLLIAINVMVAGVGVLAVGGIVYGAILYTTAEDKAEQIKKAQSVLTNVVIGLVAFALMYVALQFIIPGGVFG